MGLKDDNARLQSELKTAQQKLAAWESKWKALKDWAGCTGNYSTASGLDRFNQFYASQAEKRSASAHQRILASEGQEDLT